MESDTFLGIFSCGSAARTVHFFFIVDYTTGVCEAVNAAQMYFFFPGTDIILARQ